MIYNSSNSRVLARELHRVSLDVGGATHVMQFLDHRGSRLISRSLCERQIFMTQDTCRATRLCQFSLSIYRRRPSTPHARITLAQQLHDALCMFHISFSPKREKFRWKKYRLYSRGVLFTTENKEVIISRGNIFNATHVFQL